MLHEIGAGKNEGGIILSVYQNSGLDLSENKSGIKSAGNKSWIKIKSRL